MLGIVALIALIVIGYFIIEHIRRLKWEQKKKAGATVGAFAFISTLILLTVTGKLYILAALGTALVVFAKRLLPFLRYLPFFKGLYQKVKSNQSSKSSKQSTVETSLLKMILNHESGELDGELLDTVSKGRYLSEFDLPDLIALYTLAETQYPDSTEVLAAYLDRKYGSDWREAANAKNSANEDGQNARGANSTEITVFEAYEILGLEQNATEEEIMAAHRKLILKLHPDRGGSNYLTAKINQAKDLLLSMKGR